MDQIKHRRAAGARPARHARGFIMRGSLAVAGITSRWFRFGAQALRCGAPGVILMNEIRY